MELLPAKRLFVLGADKTRHRHYSLVVPSAIPQATAHVIAKSRIGKLGQVVDINMLVKVCICCE